jgi:hypothetical protein
VVEVLGRRFRDGDRQELYKPYRLCVSESQPHGLTDVSSDQLRVSWSSGRNALWSDMRSMQGSSKKRVHTGCCQAQDRAYGA